MVPLALAIAWTWGCVTLLSMEYSVGNVVALPLMLGIAVDSGVHIMHRFKQESGQNVPSVVRHTGFAVLLSGVTTMVGFGALGLAEHPGMAELGVVLLIGVGAGLASAVLVLPATLELVRRVSVRRRG